MVSIIVLSYNTKLLLEACLDSIFKNIRSIKFEVIVVDNASGDGSAEMVEKNFPKVKVIKNKENFGFARGNNIGAKHANGSILLFLNSDTKIIDDNFNAAVQEVEGNKNIGVIGGKLLNQDKSQQRSAGKFYNLFDVSLMLIGGDRMELLINNTNVVNEVDWVSGGFMLIKKDLFESVKGFDEHFFMYIEDMELCYRVKKLDYKILFYPVIQALHEGQGSSNRSFAVLNIYKGMLYFYKKHRTSLEYLVLRGILSIKAVIAILVGIFTGNKYLISTYRKAITYSI